MFPLLRAALRYPVQPVRTLRDLIASDRTLRFVLVFAFLISCVAALRAGAKTGAIADPIRFITSLTGFFVLGAFATAGGRWLGGGGRFSHVAAAFVGSGLPFIAVDALWIAAGGAGEPSVSTLMVLERASWVWALVLLVLGLAEAHVFSRARAALTVLTLASAGAAIILVFWALRAP